jgi:hypothetical protein
MKLHKILNRLALTASILILSVSSSMGQGNLVYNGGFEILSNNVAIGWNYNKWVDFGLGGNPGILAVLYNSDSSDPTVPTLSQTISGLIPGQSYKVSVDYELWKNSGSGLPSDPSFEVAIDGVPLFEAIAPTNTIWLNWSGLYSATSPSVTLSLLSQINGTQVSYGVDNVAMYETPEPSASSLIFLGSGLLMYVHKRHRHATQTRPLD